ncbi:MAG: 30S ribosomal protein S17 [archaeon]
MVNKTKETEKTCNDKNCPVHGTLKLRGREFSGRVTSSKANKTISIEWERRTFIPKYERYEKRKTRIKAHNPPCINAKEGDLVKIKECRPLAKTKKFCATQIIDVK